MMDRLDPVKSRIEARLEEFRNDRTPKHGAPSKNETVLESEGEKNYRSTMTNPSLKDEKSKKWTEQDHSELPKHL